MSKVGVAEHTHLWGVGPTFGTCWGSNGYERVYLDSLRGSWLWALGYGWGRIDVKVDIGLGLGWNKAIPPTGHCALGGSAGSLSLLTPLA